MDLPNAYKVVIGSEVQCRHYPAHFSDEEADSVSSEDAERVFLMNVFDSFIN